MGAEGQDLGAEDPVLVIQVLGAASFIFALMGQVIEFGAVGPKFLRCRRRRLEQAFVLLTQASVLLDRQRPETPIDLDALDLLVVVPIEGLADFAELLVFLPFSSPLVAIVFDLTGQLGEEGLESSDSTNIVDPRRHGVLDPLRFQPTSVAIHDNPGRLARRGHSLNLQPVIHDAVLLRPDGLN